MARRSGSAHALNAILSEYSENDNNAGSEVEIGSDESDAEYSDRDSDESDADSDVSDNESLQDCEIVECSQSNDNAESHNDRSLRNAQSTSVVSLLNVLRAPRPSELARKRKMAVNKPPKGKRFTSGRESKGTVNIKPGQHIKEYPSEHFTISNGKLFCEACRKQLSLKKSTLNNHIQSTKHKDRKIKLQEKEKQDQTIVQALQKYNETHHIRGETLSIEHQAYRVKVVRTFLCAAVPLNKLDKFRGLLEESAFRLSDRRFMSDHILFIFKEEQSAIKKELTDRYTSVIFDGATRLGEAMAVVVRFISNEWTLEQRLINLQMLAKSMKGEEIARELIHLHMPLIHLTLWQLCMIACFSQ